MAHDTGIPHFHNDPGVDTIRVGSKEFMCIGASPPYDHPHSFLDMGSDDDIVCPYCSTLFRYDPSLPHGGAEPKACLLPDRQGLRGDDQR